MKRSILPALVLFALLPAAAGAQERSIGADDYHNRLKGMWLGQLLGNYAGRPVEGHRARGGLTHSLDWTGPDSFTRTTTWDGDDDTCIEYLYVDLLADNANPTNADLKNTWTGHINEGSFYIANRQARWLMGDGHSPPETGSWRYNVHSYAIDSQITTESIGAMTVGHRQRAADLTGQFARVSNDGYAVHAAQFYAAMMAEAPFESDVEQLVSKGLAVVPTTSRTHEVISDAWDLYQADKADGTLDWRATQAELWDLYHGSDDYNRYRGWIESTVNTGMTTMAMLYGGGDFKSTVEIGVLAGFDADCNPATAGGVIGLMQGYDGVLADVPTATGTDYLASSWLKNIDRSKTLDELVDMLQQATEKQVLAVGGRIEGSGASRTYVIPDVPVAAPQEHPDPAGPRGLVAAVLDAGGTVSTSAAVEYHHPNNDRRNLDAIIDGIREVRWNGHMPYRSDDGENPQPAGGDWYAVEFDRDVTLTKVVFHEGDLVPDHPNSDPSLGQGEGGWFEDLIVEVADDGGPWRQVEVIEQSEPLDMLAYFQEIELLIEPTRCDAFRIRGTAGGKREFTTIVELEGFGLLEEVLAGDVDADGDVDLDDANVLRAYYMDGASDHTWYEGDFNGDGVVDFNDAWMLLSNYDPPTTSGDMVTMEYLTGGDVPEPATLLVLSAGAVALLRRRSKRAVR
ncbi:MAG: ADP-ribosylglycohydrolase family protein [Planctomycetota bacterium]